MPFNSYALAHTAVAATATKRSFENFMGVTGMVVGMNARNKRNDNDVCVNGKRVTGANVIERGRGNETREGAGVEGRSSKREREREGLFGGFKSIGYIMLLLFSRLTKREFVHLSLWCACVIIVLCSSGGCPGWCGNRCCCGSQSVKSSSVSCRLRA